MSLARIILCHPGGASGGGGDGAGGDAVTWRYQLSSQ